jgi:hypothetical protein
MAMNEYFNKQYALVQPSRGILTSLRMSCLRM